MKYIISGIIALMILAHSMITSTYAATTTTTTKKSTVSGEATIAKKTDRLKLQQRKTKLVARTALVKRMDDQQKKAVKLSEAIKSKTVKADTIKLSQPKFYNTLLRQIEKGQNDLKKLENAIALIKTQIDTIDQWLSKN